MGIGRRILAIAGGCAAGLFVMYLLHVLADQVSPLPPGLNPLDKRQLQDAYETGRIPMTWIVLIVGGWLVGAFAGGTIASRIGRGRGPAIVFAILFTAVVLADLNLTWHPTWMWLTGALGVPLIALGAAGESISFG